MRRHAFGLLPAGSPRWPPQGQDAFCCGLRQIVAGVAQDLSELPLGRYFPGSVNERRGVISTDGGPERGVLYAAMGQAEGERSLRQAEARFRALQDEIARCLPKAQPGNPQRGPDGTMIRWQMQRWIVGLRLSEAQGFVTSAEVEISVARRW